MSLSPVYGLIEYTIDGRIIGHITDYKTTYEHADYNTGYPGDGPLFGYSSFIEELKIEPRTSPIVFEGDCSNLFRDTSFEYFDEEHIDKIDYLDFDAATNIDYMFRNNRFLKTFINPTKYIDDDSKSLWYFDSAISAKGMFYDCISLQEIDFNSQPDESWLPLRKGRDRYLFGSVEDSSKMFYNCGKLTTINGGSMVGFRCKDISYIFSGCEKLKVEDSEGVLYLPVLGDYRSVENISHALDYCKNITHVCIDADLGSLVDACNSLFYETNNLTNLEFKPLHYPFTYDRLRIGDKITDLSYFFYRCLYLTKDSLQNAINTLFKKNDVKYDAGIKVTNYDYFIFCNLVVDELDLYNVNMLSTYSANFMIGNLFALKKLGFTCRNLTGTRGDGGRFEPVREWNKILLCNEMITGCDKLTELYTCRGENFFNAEHLLTDYRSFYHNKIFDGCCSLPNGKLEFELKDEAYASGGEHGHSKLDSGEPLGYIDEVDY